MDAKTLPEIKRLRNNPLAETVFELRWSLQPSGPGMQSDPGFRLLLGRYYDRVRENYPFAEDLPSAQVPEEITAHTVRHRFRAGKDQWPVTQIGPGIMSVNETEGYTWKQFKPRLIAAVAALFDAYPSDIAPLKPTVVKLRYVNAVPFDPSTQDVVRFLEENLHTKIEIDPTLRADAQLGSEPSELNLTLALPLEQPQGTGTLVFATGSRGGRPSIIWQITVRSTEDKAPSKSEDFAGWLEDAHSVVKRWFTTLCHGPLLRSFE